MLFGGIANRRNWVSRATHVQREMNSLYADFLSDIRMRRRKEGQSRGAFMDKVLDQAEDSAKKQEGLTYNDHEMWFMGGTLTEGGSDTSASIITAFVQAMVAWPGMQEAAQQQIDAVVGPDRSPTWSDYAKLPYVAQCVKEAMRWRPVTPLAFPHALAEDDWIDGMFLPKGTVIIINACRRGWCRVPNRFGLMVINEHGPAAVIELRCLQRESGDGLLCQRRWRHGVRRFENSASADSLGLARVAEKVTLWIRRHR